eukprot:CAMPEP_0117650246 /NCGR_PEP_ID=MMETSP0804-20121206/1438_1 /TAXON_ID=1074897 /ORGANISM="Tetraselmis astigmatica, Strain CCMP880" /LENGTH=1058 /DNA_ID=CAMNT_0005456107 /DNA_START=50 /DNA_END=3226 /DNA_ORIENTATION=+
MAGSSVGFVGLGAMGSGMAASLVRAGFAVKGFDVWQPSLERFVAAGGNPASSISDAATGTKVLVLMVVNAEQAQDVLFSKGAAEALPSGAVVVLCSTVPGSAAVAISERLVSMGKDLEFVDAPVSGGVARAADGALTIMSSGTAEGCRLGMTATPPGKLFTISGGPGAGSNVKMVNQLLAGVHIAAAAEAMALGARAGLDTRQLFEVISAAAGSSWMFCNRVPQMLDDDPTPHSALDIFVKDLGIVLSEGAKSKFPLPLSAAAHQQFLQGAAMGLGREADAMVVKVFPGVSVAAAKPPPASRVPISQALEKLPPEWAGSDAAAEIRSAIAANKAPLVVVLDDDPTGTQTVHGIRVLMEWSTDTLRAELERDAPGFFILTNTRAMTPEKATKTVKEICSNLSAVAGGTPFTVVLRSDSTLRGHFLEEGEAVTEVLGGFDAWVVCPFFLAGGRYTIDDTHYVKEGDELVPAADTEFAKDKAFGYSHSNLKEYVEEKTRGKVRSQDVASISLTDIRAGGPEEVCRKLLALPKGSVVVVNATSNSDLDVFCDGMLRAEQQGLRLLCRTAANFVSSRMGIPQIPPLRPADLGLKPGRGGPGGLIVVGSYVPKTTAQVEALVKAWAARMQVTYVNAEILSCDDPAAVEAEIARAAAVADRALQEGTDALVCTTRRLLSGAGAKQSLKIGNRISSGLVAIVKSIQTCPRFLLAKGGITSSDLATDAMAAKSALIVGQAAPGVPLWELGPGSRYEGMPYVVFPGNVGAETTVAEVVARLAMPPRPTTGDLMKRAAAGKCAIGAFNVYDLVGAAAVVQAAEDCGCPAMLQIHPASLRAPAGGGPLVAACMDIARRASVPITVHLDHALEGDWEEAARAGMDSVLVDGSNLQYEDNLKLTQYAVKVCHARGMAVEAEIGRLSGTEDGLTVEEYEAKLTDPDQAKEFVEATGVDMLAVCIGNVHGKYPPSGPKLDLQRLAAIREKVPGHVGLVLHGASGLPKELVEQCTAAGVVKYNVNTEVRAAYVAALRSPEMEGADLTSLQEHAHKAMVAVVKEKMELFRSASAAS